MNTFMIRVALLAVVVFTLPLGVDAAAPSYNVSFIGEGGASDISETGFVVGNTGANAIAVGSSWVWKDGVRTALPLPTGMKGSFVKAVNDDGVAVGLVTDGTFYGMFPATKAVKWTPVGSGYQAELVSGPVGSTPLIATDINNSGVVVGIARMPDTEVLINGVKYLVASRNAFQTTPGTSPVALPALGEFSDSYLNLATAPQITHNGKIYDGIRTILQDNGQLQVVPPIEIGTGVYEMRGFINASGNLGGFTTLTCASCGTAVGVRYEQGSGWSEFPGMRLVYGTFTDFNDNGDGAMWSSQYSTSPAYVHYAGIGTFGPQTLLSTESAGWQVSGATLLNNKRVLVMNGKNTTSGQTGLVLLTPTTTTEPAPTPTPTPVPEPTPTPVPNPVDTIAPVVTITLPAESTRVRSSFTLSANATDNVGVVRMEAWSQSGSLMYREDYIARFGNKDYYGEGN
jgi:Bacterial Ig domain